MRRLLLAATVGLLLGSSVGCILPAYSGDPVRRTQQLIFTSENLRLSWTSGNGSGCWTGQPIPRLSAPTAASFSLRSRSVGMLLQEPRPAIAWHRALSANLPLNPAGYIALGRSPRRQAHRASAACRPCPDAWPIDLAVQFGRLRLANPIVVASGTFGYAREMAGLVDLASGRHHPQDDHAGASHGNAPWRTVETTGGMLNSIGLDNDGIEAFVAHHLPYLAASARRSSSASRGAITTSCRDVPRLDPDLAWPRSN